MLNASDRERTSILEYIASQAEDETVRLAQKLYTERLGSLVHDVWDVHTDKARWWVITNPTNLYSQEQFPDMDLALTFHVGLCLRIPRRDQPGLDDLGLEPFTVCARGLDDAREALGRAEEVEDFQAIGNRTRDTLTALVQAAQGVIAMEIPEPHAKGADVRAWSNALADLLYPGESNDKRRGLAKAAANEAWTFTNWLTHARGATASDAAIAVDVTALAVSIFTDALIRRVRGVPERCPECGSQKLSPERASDPDDPESTYERPVCGRCAWRGNTVLVRSAPTPPPKPPAGDCVVMTRPHGSVRRPYRPRSRKPSD